MDGNVYLTGFMGTGKSTVGKILAAKTSLVFVETDGEIENREKIAIAEIFSRFGEKYFRNREKEVLAVISRGRGQVVSCGGGIVIDPDNRRLLKETGVVICLTAGPEVIYERVRHYSSRPLLNVSDPQKEIARLLRERARYYSQADYCIDTTAVSCEKAAEIIKQKLCDDKKITCSD